MADDVHNTRVTHACSRLGRGGGLLYTDGVFRVLSASVADQVGAVDPVDEFGLGLQPLHRSCEPAEHQGAT